MGAMTMRLFSWTSPSVPEANRWGMTTPLQDRRRCRSKSSAHADAGPGGVATHGFQKLVQRGGLGHLRLGLGRMVPEFPPGGKDLVPGPRVGLPAGPAHLQDRKIVV